VCVCVCCFELAFILFYVIDLLKLIKHFIVALGNSFTEC
jgi:hypothetical protein